MIDDKLKKFIENIPKAELHIHTDSVPPSVLLGCAKRNDIKLPFSTIQEAHEWYRFETLDDFLEKWIVTTSVLCTEHDYFDVAYEMGKDMTRQNIVWREAMFTYQAAHKGRVELDVVLAGFQRGRQAAKDHFGVDLNFIADIDRTTSGKDSLEFMKTLLPIAKENNILGIGLDCNEVGFPAGPHKATFDLVHEAGLPVSAHCGEEYESGPEAVWDIINVMTPTRLDHGVQSIRDEKLLAYLKESQIPLTVCPYSNVSIQAYEKLSDHPVVALRNKGVSVTVNSDDPPFFQYDLVDNFIGMVEAFDLSYGDIEGFVRKGFQSSYAPADVKEKHLTDLDAWLANNS